MNNIFINETDITFDKEFLFFIVENCSPGAIFVLSKTIKLFNDTKKYPSINDIKKVCGFSEPTFRLYSAEIRNLGEILFIVGDEKIPFIMEDKKSTGLSKVLGSTDNPFYSATGEKISSTKRRINQKVRELIIAPYIKELEKRGMGGIVYKNFRTSLFREMVHVVSQYKDSLSPQDILNIMVSALDNEYLKSIGRSTNIYFIFFNKTTSLVEKYIIQHKNKRIFGGFEIPTNGYFIVDLYGKVQNPEEYGYFLNSGGKITHIPPIKEDSLFYRISNEVENRIIENKRNSEFDSLFDGDILKDEESWRVGSCGINDRFIKK